jgi:hypothetical protein
MEKGGLMSATDEPISFEQHIRPLFRERDRQSMEWAFDLWSHADVAGNSGVILERLQDGTMPCDGAWSDEQIAVFQGWVDRGTPP